MKQIEYGRLLDITYKLYIWIYLYFPESNLIFDELGLSTEEKLFIKSNLLDNNKKDLCEYCKYSEF